MTNIITCYEDDSYSYITYGYIILIIMKDNNYVNATRICNHKHKRFEDWLKLKESKRLICEVARVNKKWKSIKSDKLIIEVNNKGNKKYKYDISGNYVHQDLLYNITNWISPSYAVVINKLINCYMYNDYEIRIKDLEDDIIEIVKSIDIITNDYYKEITDIVAIINEFVKKQVTILSCSSEQPVKKYDDGLKYLKHEIEEIKSIINYIYNTLKIISAAIAPFKQPNNICTYNIEEDIDRGIFFI
ncbi:N1R/p28 family protein [Turkeypox virus]|uniref:N1R/p28 family protein n=1 Tax=Turkeypox virus TaxID=336486 RepID=A0A0M3ZPN4_9POXV|nr:N1R/p28 family protein [Turkeypox virus]ALA62489.1 N1R/p28 family protein [Turkeypox virus]